MDGVDTKRKPATFMFYRTFAFLEELFCVGFILADYFKSPLRVPENVTWHVRKPSLEPQKIPKLPVRIDPLTTPRFELWILLGKDECLTSTPGWHHFLSHSVEEDRTVDL